MGFAKKAFMPGKSKGSKEPGGFVKLNIKIWAVVLWLVIWEVAARFIGQEILLVSPVIVLLRFFQLAASVGFWEAVIFSFIRITGGFFCALLVGILLAWTGSFFPLVKEMVAPVMAAVKAIPVASFIILVLLWIPSRNLSFAISFLIVLPVIYTNILCGIENTDKELLEMAEVFRVPCGRRIRYIYLPEIIPYFRAACSVALGLCWKAGIAAEVIGMPSGSIGERLYEAKIYLETPDLFAWTLTIVLISICFEKIFLFFVDKVAEME